MTFPTSRAHRILGARGKTIGKDVDYDRWPHPLPPAPLQNLLNGRILAARRELSRSPEEIADALERIVAGAAKEGAVMSEQKKLVAYHEAGHAIGRRASCPSTTR